MRYPVGPNVQNIIWYIGYIDSLGFQNCPETHIDLILKYLNNNYSQFVMNKFNEIGKTPIQLLSMLGTAENNMIKAETIPILMANKVNAIGKEE